MDADEKLLLVEINRFRKGKSAVDKQVISAEIQEILHTQTELPKQEVYSSSNEQELNLVRLLMQSGHKKFMEDATVADFIFKELKDDDALQIENPLYQKVLNEVTLQMEKELVFDEQFFINHEDGDIRKMAADFMTERHELSETWLNNGLLIKTEKENYVNDLQSLFLFLKKHKLEKLIKANLDELGSATEDHQKQSLLHYHMQLIEVRNAIAEILGTIMN
jgi:DNA primase